jgi:hypothetical protein
VATKPGKQPWQPVERWWRNSEWDIEADYFQRRIVQAIETNLSLTSTTRIALSNMMAKKDKEMFQTLREKNSKTKLTFIDKLDFTKKTTKLLYFRKMSPAEWADIQNYYSDKPLEAALKFKNTDLYRVWLTSSEGMVRKFINEVATTNADVTVKFVLKTPVIGDGLCLPHQKPGVQTDKTKIAVHRETFAEIGHFCDEDLVEVRSKALDHNISFTLTNVKKFHDALSRYELVQ